MSLWARVKKLMKRSERNTEAIQKQSQRLDGFERDLLYARQEAERLKRYYQSESGRGGL